MGRIEDLHREVDRAAARLAVRHRERLKCARGCSHCCQDGLTVFAVEAERIQRNCGQLLKEGSPHPPGRCAFLGPDQECRIYENRPYVCRTQGLPLRWLEEGSPDGLIELRDICPLNQEGTPIEDLPAKDCWAIGPVEQRLADLQSRQGTMKRVALRDLFTASPPKP